MFPIVYVITLYPSNPMQDELEGQVNSLEGLTDTVVTNTSDLVNTINGLILNITGNTLPQFLDQVCKSHSCHVQIWISCLLQNVSGALDRVFMLVDSYILHLDTQVRGVPLLTKEYII